MGWRLLLLSFIADNIYIFKEVLEEKEQHLSAIVQHIYSKLDLFWIWIGLMLAVLSRLFCYKNITWLLLRNFADNLRKYKANFLKWFPTNLRLFIVYETNYSYQFFYLIKKMSRWYSEGRESWLQEDAWRKNRQYILHIFINIVHFLIFVDKSWFKVTNLFIYLSIHVYI